MFALSAHNFCVAKETRSSIVVAILSKKGTLCFVQRRRLNLGMCN